MGSRDLGLEYKLEDRKNKLRRLEERIEKIDKKIDEGVDFEEEEKLETRKDNTFAEISEVNQEIKDIERELQQQTEQSQENDLLRILQAAYSSLEELENAYRTTVAYLAVPAPVEITAASDIWKALDLIVYENQQYSAVEIFVACLMNGTQSSQLNHALRDWGQEYYPDSNWSAIYAAVQRELEAKSQNFQPAILIKLSLAEEKTTQSGNQPYYRLEAWLIENLETYQQQGKRRTGHHNLVESGTAAAEPFLIDDIESKVQPLLEQWLSQKKRLINCKLDPEFYVFLPKSLLHLSVDYWPLTKRERPNRLGHRHKVIVCCADRLDGPYPDEPWRGFWQRYEDCADRKASDVFADADVQDVDALIDALAEAAEDVIGFKFMTAPDEASSEEVFEELLFAGIPAAIWGRCNQPAIDNADELDKILQNTDRLEALPQTLQKKRAEARKRANTPECHIGHHISLLRDNPKLIPPAYRSA